MLKSIELFHKSGYKYVIAGIPNVDESQHFKIEWQVQKLIDEIEQQSKPDVKYSFLEYFHDYE